MPEPRRAAPANLEAEPKTGTAAEDATTVRPAAATAPTAGGGATAAGRTSALVSAGALMAAGTLLSRVLGFGRLMLLVFLFGNSTRQADMFNLANSVPNSMYILLAGGVLNTVLVPQIVRAIAEDRDRGEAYTNRVMTLGLLALAGITVLLTAGAPLVIHLYSSSAWRAPGVAAQYDSMVALACYCMPQVFFYGVHVLAGQVLNARDRFGPMMWAPIANNVVSIAVLALYAGVFGRGDTSSAFSTGEELLLGLGSTLGIAVQAAVLVPFLRASGYRFRPRFDLRGVGLGKTVRLAKWTLGYVLVTQLAVVVVTRLASGATANGSGAGLAAYNNAYAVWILPHSLVTVSLATAMLPAASRLAAAGDLDGVAAETLRAVRLALTALLPAAVGLAVLGLPIARLAFGFGRGARDAGVVGWALVALAVGLVPFTIQYLCLRAFYALEDTRTPFFLQLVISAANVLLALAAVAVLDRPSLVATGLGLAYSLAYVLGVGVSLRRLHRRLPALDTTDLLRHCVRLLVAVTPAALVAAATCWGLADRATSQPARAGVLALAGVLAVGVFGLAARMLRIAEVTAILRTVLRRGGGGSSSGGPPTAGSPPPDPGPPAVGDSDTLVRPTSLTINPAPTAGPGFPAPSGTNGTTQMSTVTLPADPEEGADPEDGAEPGAAAGPATGGGASLPRRAATLPAGTVLGSRYRLEELLAVSGPAITWRATDEVLSRSVLVHLLPPGDEAEADLLAAARRASLATDARFLRVLDAVPRGTRGPGHDAEVGSYIVCEYATGQSLEVILGHGPLSGLEAGWVVREVADALSGVHGLGLHHQRISPESVIITPTGNVKIVGLVIEATLRPARTPVVPHAVPAQDPTAPATADPEQVDVTDLGRLLYATLVCRWPGGPAFGLAAAPSAGRGWLTPRQVRAGVPPTLDAVCDRLLGDPPRGRVPRITTANELVNALTKVLGAADASGDLERRLRQPVPRVGVAAATPVSTLLDQPTEPTPVVGHAADDERDGEPTRPYTAAADASPRRISTPVPAAPAPAVAAPAPLVSASVPAPAAAPVAAEPATAAAPAATAIRTPVPSRPVVQRDPAARRAGSARPPRRWVALLAALVVLLTGVALVTGLVLDDQLGAAPAPGPAATPARAPSATPSSDLVPVTGGRDFDPQGDPDRENPDEVPLAFDGNPHTRWRTVAYLGNPRLGGLKRGVGLVLDLGSAQSVAAVHVDLSGTGTDLDLRVPADDPAGTTRAPLDSDRRWTVVAGEDDAGHSATLTPQQPVTTRFVLVYLTKLPKEGSRYRGGISEVEVRR